MDGVYIDMSSLRISLDSSLRHITKTACMGLSGALANGIVLVGDTPDEIVIYKDRIDFGRCKNPELSGVSGRLYVPNFFKEYNRIIYRFGTNYKCSLVGGTLDYVGFMAPTYPDNDVLYNLIYPRFL